MKKTILLYAIGLAVLLSACKKDKTTDDNKTYGSGPRTEVPAAVQGKWMYGNFSMTEYWNQNPGDYLGPAVQFAIAFQFNANGTYEQYFTSSTVTGGSVTYQQSLTKGTVEVNAATGSIQTHAASAHYKRTSGGRTVEERDMTQTELDQNRNTAYNYTTGTEPNGTKAIYLTLQGTTGPLTFLQKF